MKLFDQFKKLPAQQQFMVVVLVILAVYFLKTWIVAKKMAIEETVKNETEINTLKQKGITPSYTREKYLQFADGLFVSMDGPGTDEERIIRIFSYLHNNADFISLDSAFGIREFTEQYFGTGYTMREWLRDDLDEGTIQMINNQLSKKGISKRI